LTSTVLGQESNNRSAIATAELNFVQKRGPTDRQKVPDKRGENRGRCFHPKAQRRTRPNLCPPNLAQASLSLVTGVVASILSLRTPVRVDNSEYPGTKLRLVLGTVSAWWSQTSAKAFCTGRIRCYWLQGGSPVSSISSERGRPAPGLRSR
jgi:hypothetical protein